MGVFETHSRRISCDVPWVIGVMVCQGLMLLTRTPRSAHSAAQERVRCTTPALEAL